MYYRTRHTRKSWTTVTDPSLAALVGSMLAVVLVPAAVTFLAGHLALGGGLLIGIGLSQLLSRLNRLDAGTHQPSNRAQRAELPVWFEGVDERLRVTAQSSSD